MCALWCSVKNIFTFGTRVAQDGSMTFNRPVWQRTLPLRVHGQQWTTRDTQRMWNASRASSFVFAVSVLEEQAEERAPAPLWRCIDVSTLWGWRHDV